MPSKILYMSLLFQIYFYYIAHYLELVLGWALETKRKKYIIPGLKNVGISETGTIEIIQYDKSLNIHPWVEYGATFNMEKREVMFESGERRCSNWRKTHGKSLCDNLNITYHIFVAFVVVICHP